MYTKRYTAGQAVIASYYFTTVQHAYARMCIIIVFNGT